MNGYRIKLVGDPARNRAGLMSRLRYAGWLAGCCALVAMGAVADTNINGFGTLSLSCFSSDKADYVLNLQPEGPGGSGRCDMGIDSVFGLQLQHGLSDRLRVRLQAVADLNPDGSYQPELNVAHLHWQAGENTVVRIGRSPVAAFLHSEDRLVRYAQPWVRPPIEVYGLAPVFTQDGAELLHRGSLGNWNTEWHGGLSRVVQDVPAEDGETSELDGKQGFLNLSLYDQKATIKLGYSIGRVSIANPDLELLLGLLRSMGPASAQLADELALDDSIYHLISIGGLYETSGWNLQAEIAYRTIESYFRDQYGAYVTLLGHYGRWDPYLTLARRITRGADSDSRIPPVPFLQGAVEGLLASSRYDSSSVSIGVLYELNAEAVLKMQLDWIQPDDNSWGLYMNHADSYDYANPDSDLLLTLNLDFIF